MFSISKQTHPATGVEHAISCYFLNKVEKCLVTAGANVLKIFKLIPDIESRSKVERYSGNSGVLLNIFSLQLFDTCRNN